MINNNWNKCQYCGQFIAIDDFVEDKAINRMVTPDSHISVETYETYHIKCKEEDEKRLHRLHKTSSRRASTQKRTS